MSQLYDAVVVGGGPAGLSAALVLGRCCRKVAVCDTGKPRNASAAGMHNFLTRDGIPPAMFLCMAREEIARVGVEYLPMLVTSAVCVSNGSKTHTRFEVTLEDGRKLLTRKLLLATGVIDVLPQIPGITTFYGKSVHHCPYCDAFEHRGKRIAAYGDGAKAAGLALNLRTWTDKITACSDTVEFGEEMRERLKRNGIALREERVVGLEGEGTQIQRIVFESGPPLECDALFLNIAHVQRSNLPMGLDCQYDEDGHIIIGERGRTHRPGLFVAGDADGDVQFVINASSQGATAAVAMNRELQDEDRGVG